MAHVVSVNVGEPRQIGVRRGRPLMSAIGKQPVSGRVRIAGASLTGDAQADRRVHGGPDKAIYAYAAEDTAWWAGELERELPAGAFGENLTVSGVDVTGAEVGERWTIGDVVLEVAQPRLPCFKLGVHFGDSKMVRRFAEASRPGAYLRVVEEGELGAGDTVTAAARPGHGITMEMVARAVLLDESLLATAAAAPALPPALADWMRERAG